MDKILEGKLARIEVPDLLTFLHMGRRTGVLVMERPAQETKFFFRDGNPVYATSTKDEMRIGAMLVRLGKVSAQGLEHILARHRAGGHRMGQVLLQEKILTEDELASFLKVQVSEVIFDTFEWKDGVFGFYDKVPPPATAVMLEMDLQNLIMEGVRRIDERGRIRDSFPDLDMVVQIVANPERVRQSVTLTREEWQVFFLVDGRRSLSEICRLVGGSDELQTLQVLHNLYKGKFIALVPAAEVPPEAAPPPPAVEPEGTQKMIDGRPPPPVGPVQVEFSPPTPAGKVDDDTKDVVNKRAIGYMADAKKLTVSRLVLVKDGSETSFPMVKDSYTLGRHRNNDIVITDPKVSSFHARIDRSTDGFLLVDLKSRNGCFVNGRRVESGVLRHGDEVRLGTAKLIYKVDYTSAVG